VRINPLQASILFRGHASNPISLGAIFFSPIHIIIFNRMLRASNVSSDFHTFMSIYHSKSGGRRRRRLTMTVSGCHIISISTSTARLDEIASFCSFLSIDRGRSGRSLRMSSRLLQRFSFSQENIRLQPNCTRMGVELLNSRTSGHAVLRRQHNTLFRQEFILELSQHFVGEEQISRETIVFHDHLGSPVQVLFCEMFTFQVNCVLRINLVKQTIEFNVLCSTFTQFRITPEQSPLKGFQDFHDTVFVFQSNNIPVSGCNKGHRVGHATGRTDKLHKRGTALIIGVISIRQFTFTVESACVRPIADQLVVLFNSAVSVFLRNTLPEFNMLISISKNLQRAFQRFNTQSTATNLSFRRCSITSFKSFIQVQQILRRSNTKTFMSKIHNEHLLSLITVKEFNYFQSCLLNNQAKFL